MCSTDLHLVEKMPGLVATGLATYVLCSLLKVPATLSTVSWALGLGPLRGINSSFLLQVDTASEVEELEVDSVSLLPAAPEGNAGGAKIQVFLARYR